jgi:hypothetical protein
MHRFVEEWERIWSSSLARNASWMLLGQALSIICQGICFILLRRLLGSTEYGIYVGALAMASIVSRYGPSDRVSFFCATSVRSRRTSRCTSGVLRRSR